MNSRCLSNGMKQDLIKPLTFAVLGDNQGNDDVLARIIDEINGTDASFLIHLGDLVPSGQEREYDSFLEVMTALEIPWFAVPGNHDVRGEGMTHFERLIGPREYGFDLGGYQFLFHGHLFPEHDGSTAVLAGGAARQPTGDTDLYALSAHGSPGKKSFLPGSGDVKAFMEQVTDPDNGVQGLFTGHIHMFHHDENGRDDPGGQRWCRGQAVCR
jgi:predicted phosphodiesterase